MNSILGSGGRVDADAILLSVPICLLVNKGREYLKETSPLTGLLSLECEPWKEGEFQALVNVREYEIAQFLY